METFFISPSFLLLSLLAVAASAAFSPADHYLIDCGSPRPTTLDVDHRRFAGDSSGYGSRFLTSSGSFSINHESNPSPVYNTSPIYQTARVFTAPSNYIFKIKDQGTHMVRLHFHRIPQSKLNDCHVQFHVSANGFVLLYNFTSSSSSPQIKDFLIWIDVDELVITFTPSKYSKLAFINAIEVISTPKDLIADVAYSVGSANPGRDEVNGLQKKALETSYRVTVGGVKVTPFNDSLWRTWNPDDQFLKYDVGSDRIYFGSRIYYRPGGASREVCPDNVYNTARVIRSSGDSLPETNMTWVFPVDGDYEYLIRLHFCDIASVSIGTIHFNVYINGKLSYYDLDLSERTNWRLASPLYADFISSPSEQSLISISVGPSNASMPNGIDGILNGVEIMKMSNRMGSLDGNVCAGSILKRWSHESYYKWNVIPVIAAACLLVTVSMAVVHKRRAWFGGDGSIAWSPLPTTSTLSELNLKSSST
ncbi:probable receptor-like protein kinase At5g24010 [Impatiens glandulifera]|uniref:probable receptor-like protein kinase At5g24010 n=1 Tax=Impatiens glandulifera TaxID=253017 RepID=UPI001FB14CB7|nr:probable receptor-like protein kinase At5g24010 [Impatiens glandulifera]